MYNNQLNSVSPGHMRSRSYNELLSQFKASITSKSDSNSFFNKRFASKKRSLSDLLTDDIPEETTKRSRTAPPSPPLPCFKVSTESALGYVARQKKRARSLSPEKATVINHTPVSPVTSKSVSPSVSPKVSHQPAPALAAQPARPVLPKPSERIVLPGIDSVLNGNFRTLPKPVTPTTSLDYYDTYKPNDENWRYGLMDAMDKNAKKYFTSNLPTPETTKPVFDSRISPRLLSAYKPSNPHMVKERKINYPYESNYTYLNKTYLRDVERYPEYLELAQSLVNMSNSPNQPGYQLETPQVQRQYYGGYPPHGSASGMPFPPLYPYNSPSAQAAASSAFITPPMSRYPVYTPQTSAISKGVDETPTPRTPPKRNATTKFIPITPPSAHAKAKNEAKSPPRSAQAPRVCISCGSDQSPCWRPSWSSKEGQLCNSCGLRYKKTSARCLNDDCRKIPAKGEWSLMLNKGVQKFEDGTEGHCCLECGWKVEVKK